MVLAETAATLAAPPAAACGDSEGAQKIPEQKTPETAVAGAGRDALRKLDANCELEAAVERARAGDQDRGDASGSEEQNKNGESLSGSLEVK